MGGGVGWRSWRGTARLVHRFEAERLGLELDDGGLVPRPIIPGEWEASRPGEVPPGAGPDEPGGAWGRRADAIYRGNPISG